MFICKREDNEVVIKIILISKYTHKYYVAIEESIGKRTLKSRGINIFGRSTLPGTSGFVVSTSVILTSDPAIDS